MYINVGLRRNGFCVQVLKIKSSNICLTVKLLASRQTSAGIVFPEVDGHDDNFSMWSPIFASWSVAKTLPQISAIHPCRLMEPRS